MKPLPIDPYLPKVIDALRARGAAVVTAEPGAGKTTRVPRALLEGGVADEGAVVVVQPRRLATRMAAARVADELGEGVGDRVGYRVRFDRKVSARTRVEFVTDGILARRLAKDPRLEGVAAVVFDELHERQLDVDLALALTRRLQGGPRPDLRVVAMSATLDASPVAAFLDAPVLDVPGRAFPVDVEHAAGPDDRPLERQVRSAVVRLLRDGLDGDVLVFLPGAGAIRRSLAALEGPAAHHGVDVLPLHGDLPPAAQDRAVRPGRRPKVILSTNVAETSLTIDGVVAVVDSGLARVPHHSPWTGVVTLDVVPISRASATQRAGRAGRTRPGRCVRLYAKGDHDRRPEREAPEIARADLAGVALRLLVAGDDPRTFPYFEPPPAAALDAARELLERLGATRGGAVTDVGRALSGLPLHPRLARLAVEASRRGHRAAGAAAAAVLAERDIRAPGRWSERARREVGPSDLTARLDDLESARSGSVPRHLDRRAVASVERARRQIDEALRGVTLDDEPTFDEEEALQLAALAGFPDRVAKRRRPGGREVVLAGGGTAELTDDSTVEVAEWLVALDGSAQRGRVRVRLASAIEPEQLIELFGDRVEERRVTRFDPDLERVVATAELAYDGLVLDASRSEPGDEEAARVLTEAVLDAGLQRVLDVDALDRLRRRVAFARRFDERLPDLGDARVEAVLRRVAEGRRSFAELRDADLLAVLLLELPQGGRARLDRLAPTHVALPGRRRVPVTYEPDRPPWIASRLQDFFGLEEGPRVADGREALVLHLLAPNRRAVQVTTDLSGFWDRHYPELRRSLSRRYPKHRWPEDPRRPAPR
ncbi:MAG: ATP-dependent helicase HrpB [Sandaracinaceae bacterium]